MISLRARLALLMVSAIVAVVVLAAFVTFQIVEGPRDGSFEKSFAEEVRIVSALVGGSADRGRAAGLVLGTAPDDTQLDRERTRSLREELARQGSDIDAWVVSRNGESRIGIPIAEGAWAYLAYLNGPPSPLPPLLAYLSLVTMGAVAVALLTVARILGPLRVMEKALSAVRPDGTLAPIPETGPPEVRATAHALNTLSFRLATATESRMRLIAAAGHDLRTPMTRLRLRAEFLPEEDRDIWLRDLEELDRIADSAIHLVREEVERALFEQLSLAALVEEVVDELSDIGLSATLAVQAVGTVSGQPMALKRALRNIVENAARHGGGATVSVLETGADALVVVEDEGPGIPDDLLGRVFEPFFRVDEARRKTQPGAGLGLAIALEIVERHGGTLQIGNRPSGGLRQEIRLPGLRPALPDGDGR